MASHHLRVGLIGSGGRMGHAITEVAQKELSSRLAIAAALDREEGASFRESIRRVDCFIDVSAPKAAAGYLKELAKSGARVPYVIGCTGWTDAQLEAVRAYSKKAPVVLAPNFSPGVNLFLGLLERAAPLLKKWGYDASVHEIHHTRKRDAPSGTAKAIVEAIKPMAAQVHSTRAGNIVGLHEVRFMGPSDTIILEHEALDRSIFARGALMAAEWASWKGRKPGLYSMKEVVFGDGHGA